MIGKRILFNQDRRGSGLLCEVMEQARLWMWEKPSHSLINGSSTSHVQASMNSSSYDDSWEEQAFAEDAAGPLGGCIWPPRSYTCSFCRREFRSAQALGGHMNIHRRDRARLKQSANFQNEIQHHRKDIQTHSSTCDSQDVLEYPSQVRTLLDNPNPSALNFGGFASSSSASRVSISPSNKESLIGKKRMLPITSNVQMPYKTTPFSAPLNFVHGREIPRYFDSDTEGESSSRIVDIDQIDRRSSRSKFAKPDLSVRLNLIVCRTNPSGLSGSDKEETISCKRIRIDSSNVQSSLDDLDLELRLGKRPKVK